MFVCWSRARFCASRFGWAVTLRATGRSERACWFARNTRPNEPVPNTSCSWKPWNSSPTSGRVDFAAGPPAFLPDGQDTRSPAGSGVRWTNPAPARVGNCSRNRRSSNSIAAARSGSGEQVREPAAEVGHLQRAAAGPTQFEADANEFAQRRQVVRFVFGRQERGHVHRVAGLPRGFERLDPPLHPGRAGGVHGCRVSHSRPLVASDGRGNSAGSARPFAWTARAFERFPRPSTPRGGVPPRRAPAGASFR